MPYKRIDLAIEVCNRLQKPLVIIGSGRDENRLKSIAGPTIRFMGRLSDEELDRLSALIEQARSQEEPR